MNCHGCLAHFVLHSTVFFHFLGLVLSWEITSALSLWLCHLSFDETQAVLSCKNHLSFFGATDTASLFFGYFWICGSIWKFSPAEVKWSRFSFVMYKGCLSGMFMWDAYVGCLYGMFSTVRSPVNVGFTLLAV